MIVRGATLADVPAITEVHAGSDGPWVDPVECTLHVNHRLLRPFFIDVAERDDCVVGYAEWNDSSEPQPHGRHLYLGVLQVHPAHRRSGVGRALVEAGLARARQLGCPCIRTVPADEAKGFYAECGLSRSMSLRTYACRGRSGGLPAGWRRAAGVPESAVAELPMRYGWVQASSRLMWEICNRPARVAGERIQHPCSRRVDGLAYAQLRWLGERPTAMALAWAADGVDPSEVIGAAMALAHGLELRELTFTAPQGNAAYLTELPHAKQVGTDDVWEVAVA